MFRATLCSSSGGRAQSSSKHVEDSNKHIIEEIVLQVGHDARSEKYVNAVRLLVRIFFFIALLPNAGHGLRILEDFFSRSHTKTHHSL